MRNPTIRLSTALALGLALASARADDKDKSTSAIQPTAPHAQQTGAMAARGSVRVATEDAEDHTDRKLAGQHVRGRASEDLGRVHDFLVDAASGRVEYAVISSGGLGGMGDKLRLLPMSALRRGEKEDEFSLAIDEAQWNQITPLSDEAFKAAEVTVTDDEKRRLAGHFSGSAQATTGSDSRAYTASQTARLLKASDLRGKDVRSGSQEIGSIEGLVVDLQTGTASALFDGKRDFLGTNQKYLVPLSQFTLASKEAPAETSLTRADFTSGSTVSSTATGTLPVATGTADNTSAASPTTAGTSTANKDASADSSLAASTQATQSTNAGTIRPSGGANSTTATGTNSSTMTRQDSTSLAQSEARTKGETRTDKNDPGQDVAPSSSSSLGTGAAPSVAGTSTPPRSATADGPGNASKPASDREATLSPTGKSSADQNPAGTSDLVSAARAVRKALDDDATLARAGVMVTPENGRLILRGSVTAEQKSAIEEKAERAAGGQEIDSQMTVGSK